MEPNEISYAELKDLVSAVKFLAYLLRKIVIVGNYLFINVLLKLLMPLNTKTYLLFGMVD
jgi:hypothetical protein